METKARLFDPETDKLLRVGDVEELLNAKGKVDPEKRKAFKFMCASEMCHDDCGVEVYPVSQTNAQGTAYRRPAKFVSMPGQADKHKRLPIHQLPKRPVIHHSAPYISSIPQAIAEFKRRQDQGCRRDFNVVANLNFEIAHSLLGHFGRETKSFGEVNPYDNWPL